MKFEKYQTSDKQWRWRLKGQWRWRLKGKNGEIIASGESYRDERDCDAAIDLVKGTNKDTPVVKVDK
jgi:uncharacterized protein YegP (UPF0339 family)